MAVTSPHLLRACIGRYEQAVQLQSFELAIFLYSVCDVVLVVEDWSPNIMFWRFLQSTADLQPLAVHGQHTVSRQSHATNPSSVSRMPLPEINRELDALAHAMCLYTILSIDPPLYYDSIFSCSYCTHFVDLTCMQ